MTIKELKDKLKDLPDDLEVVTNGLNHSYNRIRFAGVCVAEDHTGDLYEYYDDERMIKNSKKISVFFISDD